jgi:carotenoid cleavage dioxygenase-like enzyme
MTDNLFLTGNFGPVADEHTAQDLRVTGTIPEALEGRLLRIGPNPVAPDPANYHWFLGNGMVHGVALRNGRALWYRSRFVRDDEVVAAKGWPPVAGPQREFMLGGGLANTHVISHAGKTLALVEGGNLPVELSRDLETIARSDFGGTLPAGFSAHPKRDPDTGELHAAVYGVGAEQIQYVVVGVDGRVRKTVEVPVPGAPMVHDCAITKNYFLLLDLPVVLDRAGLETGSGGTLPYTWQPEYGARVGLLPRAGGAGDVIWHELSPCFVFHPLNAFEDADGRVVVDVIRHPQTFASARYQSGNGPPTLDRWTIDPHGGPVKEERLDDRPQEFPRCDERRVGKPHRYGYSIEIGAGFRFEALLKHDLREGRTERHVERSERLFMEPVFVPRTPDAAEDDGWVLAYTYDTDTDRSAVVILEAQDFSAGPIATIELPTRVPFGFHGSWIPDPS